MFESVSSSWRHLKNRTAKRSKYAIIWMLHKRSTAIGLTCIKFVLMSKMFQPNKIRIGLKRIRVNCDSRWRTFFFLLVPSQCVAYGFASIRKTIIEYVSFFANGETKTDRLRTMHSLWKVTKNVNGVDDTRIAFPHENKKLKKKKSKKKQKKAKLFSHRQFAYFTVFMWELCATNRFWKRT